ncbi:hypothetical protein BCR35DRAFT_298190 [Leucosporidium creatinivorum]|uniref:DUF221-domain-containing protein n=1 Tax=Leucosporidium creatinivorum TaxID=106004 RepID=A0A1Y2G449_9BASI|nr:hypothetical protein BCR35DRAFT_298190 [Leucosporidium creatinivorum]
MTKFCSVLPGGVKRIWLARDLKELPDLYDRRQKACGKLESAETKILKLAAKAIIKQNKKGDKQEELPQHGDNGRIDQYVTGKARPHHKLGFLGLFGEKVDTLDWARKEIAETTRLIEEERTILAGPGSHEKYPAESAAFIQFNQQIAAHMFAQCLAHHAPLRMSARYLEVSQEDVIWSNLSVNPYQAKVRYAASWAMTVGLIILWSFPVAFVGLISNVSALCISAPWLAWLCKLPVPVNGIIQGALPPVALAVLFILLPIVLRLFARLEGIPLKTGIELSLMTRYFMFLVIHGFLIVTLASGLVNSIPAIAKNPSSAVTLLATQLPAASTFFLTYFVTTSFAGAAGGLLQIVPLILYYYNMNGVAWGTLWPNMTLLTVIGLSYSIIAPLICGFAFIAFFLYWFVYKYLFLLVIDTPHSSETGGLFYPKALSHIFVGLYIEEVCLAGLFFLAQDNNKKNIGIPQGALMVVLIVFTIFFHLTINSGYGPLIDYLPLSVAPKISALQNEASPEQVDSRFSTEEKRDHLPSPSGKNEEGSPLNKPQEFNGTLPGEEHIDRNAFDHPATYEGYPTIWIPQDSHGLTAAELEATQAAGVDVSAEGAIMNEKGKVDVHRSPPGDEWDPSQTL